MNLGNVIAGSKEEIRKQKKKEYSRQWRLKNKGYLKQWRLKNKGYLKQWRLKNKEKINKYKVQYQFHRYRTDIKFKLKYVLKARFVQALKGNYKSKSISKLLGCTLEQLWQHLESKFQPGMTRENHGKWHIDHIRPCASFDLTKPEEQAKCFHYTNLQPLWANENLSKNAKYDPEL